MIAKYPIQVISYLHYNELQKYCFDVTVPQEQHIFLQKYHLLMFTRYKKKKNQQVQQKILLQMEGFISSQRHKF